MIVRYHLVVSLTEYWCKNCIELQRWGMGVKGSNDIYLNTRTHSPRIVFLLWSRERLIMRVVHTHDRSICCLYIVLRRSHNLETEPSPCNGLDGMIYFSIARCATNDPGRCLFWCLQTNRSLDGWNFRPKHFGREIPLMWTSHAKQIDTFSVRSNRCDR